MSAITVEQIPLNVDVVGQGQPLVMLHGWGLNSRVWGALVPQLSQDFTLYLIDLPGYGFSQPVSEPVSLKHMAERISLAIPNNSIVLGWSMGGLVATELALTYPHKVAALVSVCSSPKFEAANDWPGIDAKVLSEFRSMLQQNFSATVDRFLAIQAMGAPNAKKDILTLRKQIRDVPAADLDTLDAGLNFLHESDLRQVLPQLTMPTLRLYGKLDSLVPKAAITPVSRLLPDSDCHIFAKASHAPFISYPLEFTKVLGDWLRKQGFCSEW